jgi:hypothetical protein
MRMRSIPALHMICCWQLAIGMHTNHSDVITAPRLLSTHASGCSNTNQGESQVTCHTKAYHTQLAAYLRALVSLSVKHAPCNSFKLG